jgi:radical SAM superfamily enzyme YgiQ (UPF0313 family)
MNVELDESVKGKLESKLSEKDGSSQPLDHFESFDLQLKELNDITTKLNLNSSEKKAFLTDIFQIKNTDIIEKENKLKIVYFMIKAEMERLERIKNRIDSKSNFRIRFILTALLSLLIAQTAWFYYMIFHVEFLGWDLVEPTTFLLSSSLFLIGLFSYIKLNRSAISSEHIVKGFKNKYYVKMYMKENFNIDKYLLMEKQLAELTRVIENTKRL